MKKTLRNRRGLLSELHFNLLKKFTLHTFSTFQKGQKVWRNKYLLAKKKNESIKTGSLFRFWSNFYQYKKIAERNFNKIQNRFRMKNEFYAMEQIKGFIIESQV